MSFFGGGGGGRSYSDSERLRTGSSSHHHNSHSHTRGHSPARSGYSVRPSNNARSSSSFFGGGSSRGIFNSGGSSSYYKRRPRDGYISYLMHKLQRMVKELWYYARRHPVKAFFAIIVPLLSAGGAIGGLLRQFNIRLPGMDNRSRFGSRGGSSFGGGGFGGGGFGDERGGGGFMGNAGSLMQIAKAFM